METGENFQLLYYDGSSWQTIETWVRETDFDNGVFYSAEVIIPESTYNFPTDMKIKFKCDASGNLDDIYIDEVIFTDDERRTLVEAAMAMGKDLIRQVVTIVQPKTILAWQSKLENQKWDYSDRRKNNPGRPRISLDIEQIVCRMARGNEWGYERIQGELKKLDIEVSKSSIANILRRNGLPPSPER